ncbi:MAG: phosphoribosylglycinamide synthetase C domain-containing protein [Patescibacteria group bacterium]|jgi:phosphoribosylamine--glycine ligase
MKKIKFLFVSADNLIGNIAWHVYQEGHLVKYCNDHKGEEDLLDGFLPKVKNWRKYIDWADVIVFDEVFGYGKIAEKLRAQGKLVLGGTAYTDSLEEDRSFGQQELKKAGVPILPYYEFNSCSSANRYLKKHPGQYVVKVCGKMQNDKNLVYVGQLTDGSDVRQMLELYQERHGKKITSLILQKKVNGVEIALGAFFNGQKFVYPINLNFEHKKLFPGDLGPNTGEIGTHMFWAEPNVVFDRTLKKMEGRLREVGYHGCIDLACIVNGQGIYPLEFTARFCFPTINIQYEGLKMPVSDFLYKLALGEDFKIKTKKGFQVGIRVLVPPNPYRNQEIFNAYAKGVRVMFKDPKKMTGVHLEDVKKIKGKWVITGSCGNVLIIVGTGKTMPAAQKQVYQRVKNVIIPNMYYRNDVGDRWYKEKDKLAKWGYLKTVKY